MVKGGVNMHMKGLVLTLGVGAAIGAVAVLTMPKTNPTRRLAAKAAQKVENAAWKLTDKLSDEWNF
jgi:hypothetical protein